MKVVFFFILFIFISFLLIIMTPLIIVVGLITIFLIAFAAVAAVLLLLSIPFRLVNALTPKAVKEKLSAFSRRFRPKCPECREGRLSVSHEILSEYSRPGGYDGKLYYGMRSYTEFKDERKTVSCDRCGYKKVEEYTVKGPTYIS